MIDVRIYHDDTEIGRVRIYNIQINPDDTAHYRAEFATERIGAVGLHSRILHNFPRLKYNALALVLQALNTLSPKELELEQDVDPSDLARRQRGVGKALPSQTSDPISDYGPALWGG